MAARSACMGVKIRVTLVLIPFSWRVFVALSPSAVIGTLTTMFVWIFARASASLIIPS